MAGHKQDHDFYIPGNSIWPPLSCLGLGLCMFGLLNLLKFSAFSGKALLAVGMIILLVGAGQWFRVLIKEARERGFDTTPKVIDLANRYGMVFFIVSELMFFAGFFAAYFYIYGFNIEWPPANIEVLTIHLPTINTLLLLTSGVTITWSHHALIHGDRDECKKFLMMTWILGVIFLACQMFEYSHAAFGLSSGAYGSTFYMLTGFHGFHVFVGTAMLMVAHYRLKKGDFTEKNHFYYEATAWYWHFVDVVWIGLFLFIYALPA